MFPSLANFYSINSGKASKCSNFDGRLWTKCLRRSITDSLIQKCSSPSTSLPSFTSPPSAIQRQSCFNRRLALNKLVRSSELRRPIAGEPLASEQRSRRHLTGNFTLFRRLLVLFLRSLPFSANLDARRSLLLTGELVLKNSVDSNFADQLTTNALLQSSAGDLIRTRFSRSFDSCKFLFFIFARSASNRFEAPTLEIFGAIFAPFLVLPMIIFFHSLVDTSSP